jgi:hypothetical protein
MGRWLLLIRSCTAASHPFHPSRGWTIPGLARKTIKAAYDGDQMS